MKYKIAFLFRGQILFEVLFEGEEGLSEEEIKSTLEEQAEIMRGSRAGIIKEVEIT